jgi:hypothetical protein
LGCKPERVSYSTFDGELSQTPILEIDIVHFFVNPLNAFVGKAFGDYFLFDQSSKMAEIIASY